MQRNRLFGIGEPLAMFEMTGELNADDALKRWG